ncbi:MAG: helix-turn-helix domain containing protein [Lewinellaceae bacterium]|nr:helix-turn-helix domain containing protein [Lewinellaceae bacterium]MCB9081796.1 helix-turn-helix domain containing protein [Lewinellaceae bacterium]
MTEEQKSSLQKGYSHGKSPLYRRKCHCILLSHAGKTPSELASFFGVSVYSIRVWLQRWEQHGQEGLKLKPGRGRKSKLELDQAQHVETVKTLIKNEPKNLTRVTAQLEKKLGIEVSKRTLKRFLKNLTTDGNAFAAD